MYNTFIGWIPKRYNHQHNIILWFISHNVTLTTEVKTLLIPLVAYNDMNMSKQKAPGEFSVRVT